MTTFNRPTMTKHVSTLLILVAALGLSACNKAEDAKAPEVTTESATPAVESSTNEANIPAENATEADAPDANVTEPTETAPTAEAPTAEVTETAAATEELAADAGKALYEKQCQICHAQGLLEAPKLGDKAVWAPHIAKGKETLYEHSAKGFNKMPPQATGDVTEAQVHAAVDYMIEAAS